jgi:predicted ATP-binding protein involved in virulence
MSNNAVRVAPLELNNFRGFKTLKLAFSDKPIVLNNTYSPTSNPTSRRTR